MKSLTCKFMLLMVSLMFVVNAKAETNHHAEIAPTIKAENEYFASMQQPEWLVIGHRKTNAEFRLHLPRVHAVSELTWSPNQKYLAFTTAGKQHWLFDRTHRTLRLLESIAPAQSASVFLPQWSNDGKWLLFISHQQPQSRPRLYSIVKKHSYAVPVLTEEFSNIAWASERYVITLFDYIGNAQNITSLSHWGITFTSSGSEYLSAMN